MDRDVVMRWALWASVPANFAVAGLMLAPSSALGQLVGLPDPPPHPVYRAMLALFVALFGGAYAWLARQPCIDRALVAFAAIGKSAVFGTTFVLFLCGMASGRWTLLLSGDLAFAATFAWWLSGSGGAAARRTVGHQDG
jgi:hypothetical protein